MITMRHKFRKAVVPNPVTKEWDDSWTLRAVV
jgi:hypothetical protein